MKVGYIRVSTLEQNEARQEALMEQLGVDKVYLDKMSGKSKDRPQLQAMMQYVRDGDVVIVESISRFARNTVTLLETVRELKLLGVNVYFEEQNIYTLSADGELMMTILASYAQEERRSASENQKWRIRANFKEGLPWNGTILGYRIQDGIYVPVPLCLP